MTLKGILIFAGGALVGAACGAYAERRKYERILEEREVDLREKYKKEYGGIDSFVEESVREEDIDTSKVSDTPTRKGSFATDYQAFYKNPSPAKDPAENQHPEENSVKKLPPKMIKKEDFGQKGFREVYLEYYTIDQALVICDETEAKEIDEVKDFIGDALDRYGFSDEDNDETEIYVRNYDRNWDICIQKRWDRFSPPEYADNIDESY